ncbi:MAG: hypothetical protein ACR2PY_06545 [Salinispira sp.]
MIKTDFEKTNPPGTKYPYLRTPGAYWCAKWQKDRNGVYCMYYAFQGKCVYEKRIPLNEIHAAKKHLLEHKKFNHKIFCEQCKTVAKNGECGFAVIGRMLENSCNAEYNGSKGFVLRE